MTFPATELPVTVEARLAGTWTDITEDVLVRAGIQIGRGRPDWLATVSASTCTLQLKDSNGKYSDLNPLSPYYGLLGRNTQIRVRLPEVAFGGDGGGATATHVAPALDVADGPALLACMWVAIDASPTNFNYTVPGSMTGGPEADDGTFSASVVATQSVSAGDTGTRTATSSPAADFWMAASVSVPGTITVQERLCDAAFDTDVVLTTGAGTQAGWSLLAFQCWDVAGPSTPPPAPSGDGWILIDEFHETGWIRAWIKEVDTAGAEAITFYTGDTAAPDNHAQILVLSGVTALALPASVARRFTGEVPAWPPKWDTSGNDVWVPITAYGIMQRLEKGGAKRLKSALYREATAPANSAFMLGYWPLEDASGSTQAASGIGGAPMTATVEQPNYASSSDIFTGSDPLPTMTTGALIGNIPHRASTGVLAFRGCFFIPAAGLADLSPIADIRQTGGGSVVVWRLSYHDGGGLSIRGLASDSTVVVDSGEIGFDCRGLRVMLGFQVAQDGGNVDWGIFQRTVDDAGNVTEGGFDSTFASVTVGSATKLVLAAGGDMPDCVVGHLMVGNDVDLAALMDTALVGHAGETAGARINRLAAEEGTVTITLVGAADDTAMCGPQRSATLLELFRDAAAADGGVLFEPRHFFGLSYRTRRSLHNQEATLPLDYAEKEVVAPLEPMPDDQRLINDYTASRLGGSSYRKTLTSGKLSIQEPPDGAGTAEAAPPAVNVLSDDQLPDIAGWGLRLGTWDEARYPVINISHARLGLDDKTALSAAAAAVDIGDLVTIDNPPPWIPPDQIAVLAEGYTEELLPFGWTQSYNASAGGPWNVGVWSSSVDQPDRYDTAGSELAEDFDAGTDTTALVLTTSGPLWTTDDAKVSVSAPMDVRCSGARLRVTNIGHGFEDLYSGTHSNGWGSDWTVTGGSASEYSVSGGRARISQTSVSVLRCAFHNIGSANHRVRMTGTLDTGTITGAQAELWLFARATDADNNYAAGLLVETDDEVQLTIARRTTAGGFATIAGPVRISTGFGSGQLFTVDLSVVGSSLLAKAWAPATMSEPGWLVSVTDATITAGDLVGAGARLAGGNTNALPVQAQLDDFAVLNPQLFDVSTTVVNGVEKEIGAGEPLRLWRPAVYAR